MQDKLIAVRELLSDPARWTQGCMAKNTQGDLVSIYSSDAVCFCLLGAMLKLKCSLSERRMLRNIVSKEYSESSLSHFNDNSTHAEILSVLDKAISLEAMNND